MEPSLTPPDSADDPLDALLCAVPPEIPDDGFTARVCAALPVREVGLSQRARRSVLAAAAMLGCVLVCWVLANAEPALSQAVFDAVRGWKLEPWQALPLIFAAMIWGMIALTREDWEGETLARR
jgi:hypothetical protein